MDANQDPGSAPIPSFQKSESWIHEYQEAARDPNRTLAAHDLGPDHPWNLATELTRSDQRALKQFQDEMYKALAKQFTTSNGSKIRIRVDTNLVKNISLCFAQAKILDTDLARRTEAYFVDHPNRLLTTACANRLSTQTSFQLKKQRHLRHLSQNRIPQLRIFWHLSGSIEPFSTFDDLGRTALDEQPLPHRQGTTSSGHYRNLPMPPNGQALGRWQ